VYVVEKRCACATLLSPARWSAFVKTYSMRAPRSTLMCLRGPWMSWFAIAATSGAGHTRERSAGGRGSFTLAF